MVKSPPDCGGSRRSPLSISRPSVPGQVLPATYAAIHLPLSAMAGHLALGGAASSACLLLAVMLAPPRDGGYAT